MNGMRPPTAPSPSEVARWIAAHDLAAIATALQAGADPNSCSRYGNPLLVCSVSFEVERAINGRTRGLEVSATSLLLSHGADPFRRRSSGADRPWDTALAVRHWLAVELFAAYAHWRNIPLEPDWQIDYW